jgi:hypothetical protein
MARGGWTRARERRSVGDHKVIFAEFARNVLARRSCTCLFSRTDGRSLRMMKSFLESFSRARVESALRATRQLLATAILFTTACYRPFGDSARCAPDVKRYQEQLRLQPDSSAQQALIAAADADAIAGGLGDQQRAALHGLLSFTAHTRMVPREGRSGRIVQVICSSRRS